MELGARHRLLHGGRRLVGGARHEQGVAPIDNLRGDVADLLRRLAGGKHHFRKPLAQLALVVHPREPEVLKGTRLDHLQHLLDGRVGSHMSGSDMV